MSIKELLRYIDFTKALLIKAYINDKHEDICRFNQCLLLLRQSLEETCRENLDLIREVQ